MSLSMNLRLPANHRLIPLMSRPVMTLTSCKLPESSSLLCKYVSCFGSFGLENNSMVMSRRLLVSLPQSSSISSANQVCSRFTRTSDVSKRGFIRVQEFGHRIKHNPTHEKGFKKVLVNLVSILFVYAIADFDWITRMFFPKAFNDYRVKLYNYFRKVIGLDE